MAKYEIIGTDCCLVSRESVWISANSDLGGYTILERYPFLTAEVASLFAGILNRDAAKHAPSIQLYFTPQTGSVTGQFQTYFKSADKLVARWDHTGTLIELDLPYLVWVWLRTTAPVRVAKALWKGWA